MNPSGVMVIFCFQKVNWYRKGNRVKIISHNDLWLFRWLMPRTFILLLGILHLAGAHSSTHVVYPWQTATEKSSGRKCGFPAVLAAASAPEAHIRHQYQLWKQSRLTAQAVFTSPSGHFHIYYDTTGYHAIPDYDRDGNGIPDYLEFVALSFDRAWQVEVDSLGFQPPPDSSSNPRNHYPVYCKAIRDYGQTVLDYQIPFSNRKAFVTHVEINVDFSFVHYPGVTDPIVRDSMAIAVTAAHEFNHALQSGYNLWSDASGSWFQDIWFIESSAVYMEEVVADEVNDYLNYLDDYFRECHHSIDEDRYSLADYGKVPFEIMLGKMFGRDITRRIWEKIVEVRAIPATEKVMAEEATSLQNVFPELAKWFYYTGDRARGEYFPDAALFPSVPPVSLNDISFLSDTVLTDSLPHLAFRYYQGTTHLQDDANFILQAQSAAGTSKLSALYENALQNEITLLPAGVPFHYTEPVNGGSMQLAVVNSTLSGTAHAAYTVKIQPYQSSTEQEVFLFPQPVHASQQPGCVTFRFPGQQATVHIYTANGKRVKQIGPVTAPNLCIWKLENEAGGKVPSGVDVYYLITEDREFQGKILVLP